MPLLLVGGHRDPARRLPAGPRHRARDRLHDHGDARRGRDADPLPRRSARARSGCSSSLYALSEPYRRARLTTFLDPWAHAGDAGFQAVQGQIALGSGGLFGARPGSRCRRSSTCPRPTRTSSSRSSARSSGVAGVFGVLCLYGMIAYAGLRVAKRGDRRLREAARGRPDLADPLQACAEHLRRPRPRAADGRAAAVHLLRLDEPHRAAGGMGLLLNIAAGGAARSLKVVTGSRDDGADDRDRRRRDSGARGAGAGGRRRAAG